MKHYNRYQENLWNDYIQCLDAYVADKAFRPLAVKAYNAYVSAVEKYKQKMGVS